MIAIGWILSALDSDVCVGDGIIGPEATIEEALLQYGIVEDHLIFQKILYYKSQCTTEKSWDSAVIMQTVSIWSKKASTQLVMFWQMRKTSRIPVEIELMFFGNH